MCVYIYIYKYIYIYIRTYIYTHGTGYFLGRNVKIQQLIGVDKVWGPRRETLLPDIIFNIFNKFELLPIS